MKTTAIALLTAVILTLNANAVTPDPGGGYPGGNTALGDDSLFSLDASQGGSNTALGFEAMYNTTTGSYNVANGILSLYTNTTGEANTAVGSFSMLSNTTGGFNTALGDDSLWSNTNGSFNLALGVSALHNSNGNYNVAIGYHAGENLLYGDNNIYIGNFGKVSETGMMRIGTQGTQRRTYIAGILGSSISGVPVGIDSQGRLGVLTGLTEQIEAMNATIQELQQQVSELQHR